MICSVASIALRRKPRCFDAAEAVAFLHIDHMHGEWWWSDFVGA